MTSYSNFRSRHAVPGGQRGVDDDDDIYGIARHDEPTAEPTDNYQRDRRTTTNTHKKPPVVDDDKRVRYHEVLVVKGDKGDQGPPGCDGRDADVKQMYLSATSSDYINLNATLTSQQVAVITFDNLESIKGWTTLTGPPYSAFKTCTTGLYLVSYTLTMAAFEAQAAFRVYILVNGVNVGYFVFSDDAFVVGVNTGENTSVSRTFPLQLKRGDTLGLGLTYTITPAGDTPTFQALGSLSATFLSKTQSHCKRPCDDD